MPGKLQVRACGLGSILSSMPALTRKGANLFSCAQGSVELHDANKWLRDAWVGMDKATGPWDKCINCPCMVIYFSCLQSWTKAVLHTLSWPFNNTYHVGGQNKIAWFSGCQSISNALSIEIISVHIMQKYSIYNHECWNTRNFPKL